VLLINETLNFYWLNFAGMMHQYFCTTGTSLRGRVISASAWVRVRVRGPVFESCCG